MALSGRDYRKILEIIDIIYSVPDTGAMFRAICVKLQKLIGICSAISCYFNPKTGGLLPSGYSFFNEQEGALILYIEHYAQFDPFILHGHFEKLNNVVARNTDFVPERTLMQGEFACDFLFPIANVFYGLGSSLAAQGDKVGIVGLHRQKRQGDFSDRDKEVVNLILPHVAQALRNHQLAQEPDPFTGPCGVIALGENGQPFYINAEAKVALKGKLVKTIPEPGLGAQAAFFKSGAETFRIRTMPLGKGKRGKLILMEQYPPEYKLNPKLAPFALSKRENEVSVLVMQGLSNLEIAGKLFITEQTVKDHLHHVFEKTGVRRRGELVARVMGLAPSAGSRA